MGAAVGRSVAAWEPGLVEAFVNVRGPRLVVGSAMAWPFNGVQRDVTRDLQAALDRLTA